MCPSELTHSRENTMDTDSMMCQDKGQKKALLLHLCATFSGKEKSRISIPNSPGSVSL